jgi:hypothetical protein
VRAQKLNLLFYLPFSRRLLRCALALGFFAAALCGVPRQAAAQEAPGTPQEEIVANLAAGRVVIAVVKDAILIGTIEDPIEAQTRTPSPVQISARRAGVILGAVEWFSPSSQEELARLDKELPHLRQETVVSATPHLQQELSGKDAADIQAVGLGLLDRLKQLAAHLHSNIHLAANEPIVEVIIAGYLPNYGPEVWQLTYGLEQLPEHGEYWDTRVLRPRYLQIWPTEKGQPHTLMEFHYPPENASPSLMDLLRNKDSRIEKICASDSKMREVADRLLAGESGKILAADATQFLRAAFAAIAPPSQHEAMAVISEEKGFDWILAPPPEPKKPGQEKQREPGAPTLMKPPS